MAEELARLKEEALIEKEEALKKLNLSELPHTMSPGARNSRIFALENMLATSSSTLISMASQLSEAEERERAFSGRGRWNQVPSVADTKNVMNFLFNLASSSGCQLRDREVDCREKDTEIRDLKEKVVNTFFKSGMFDVEFLEDMDTSDDEHPNLETGKDDEWSQTIEWKRCPSRKRASKTDHHVEKNIDLGEPISPEGVCCSCSKASSCKTSRCDCRAVSGNCSSSCSCGPTRCSNRDATKDMLQHSGNSSVSDEAETSHDLAAHGAMLLQTALSEKHANQNNDGTIRKPLSDIGNNLGLSSVQQPQNLRKKRRKLAIQLVRATPPVSQPSDSEAPQQSKTNGETDIPLKLP